VGPSGTEAGDITARAEGLVERLTGARTPKKRMLVIVNPYATTVSDRLKNLVVYALESRYAVETVDTEERAHATELCREAAREGYDVVVAFGGDGTVNEAANGLAGSETPLTVLPGGSTNVWCRTLGIPNDVVDATEHLLSIADDFHPRRVDLGRVDERYFVFGSGVGLDASVVERVDAHPYRKARFGAWYYSYAAIATFSRHYLVQPPRVRLRADGREVEGVTVIVQNSDPLTYFRGRPIRVCEQAGLDTGTLSMAALTRATLLELPTLIPRLFTARARWVLGHRRIESLPAVERARVESVDGRSFPVELDGDFLGEFQSVDYQAAPRALVALA
jgi:diacylglycerol kinase family enzyme